MIAAARPHTVERPQSTFQLAEIEAAYELFGNQRDHMVTVAIRP